MKAYILFGGKTMYPNGGIHDYRGHFDSVDAAIAAVEKNNKQNRDYWDDVEGVDYVSCWEWWHIVQSSDMSIVTSGWETY